MSITVNKLSLDIGGKSVCKNLNIEFSPGEFWAVLGINGVGKSTFVHQLIDINSINANCISIDDTPLSDYKHSRKKLARKTGIMLQEYEYNFPCSVIEAALIGRHPHLKNWEWESSKDLQIAEYALRQTNLLELKDRQVSTLSGGEKRRLNFATILTQDPQYYLLDEPTNHLDLNSQIKILDFYKNKIVQERKTGIMVIHDANLAYKYCDHVLLLYGNGEWAAGKTTELITIENLNRLYGCSFQILSNENTSVFIPA